MPAGFSWTNEPLAAVHDVALLDLDGVVYVGPTAVPHAVAALDSALERFGMRAGFVTNNASRPPSVVAEHLRDLGVHAADGDVVTSAQAAARVLVERVPPGSPVLAVGGPGVSWALEERGLAPVLSVDEGPVAVVQGYGPDVGWRELAEATLAIEAGAVFVATNLDRTIPTPRGRVLGNGALVAAVQHATGVAPVVAGKPEPPLMVESVQRLRAQRPLVVGDRLDTDIEGAVRAGIPSLLVLTGVTDWHDLLDAAPVHRPDYLGLDLRELLRVAPEVSAQVTGGVASATCGAALAHVRVATGAAGPTGAALLAGLATGADGSGIAPGGDRSGLSPACDLDAVRCVVAISWLLSDRGLRPEGALVVQSSALAAGASQRPE